MIETLEVGSPEWFRLAVENAVLDGIAGARLLWPDNVPPEAEDSALRTLTVSPAAKA